MRQINNNNIVILSAHSEGLTRSENTIRQLDLMRDLNDLKYNYKALIGYYRGKREQSLLVVLPLENYNVDLNILISLSRHYDQECILFADEIRDPKLIYLNGKETKLGTLTPVSKMRAFKEDNYSYDVVNEQYYITINKGL